MVRKVHRIRQPKAKKRYSPSFSQIEKEVSKRIGRDMSLSSLDNETDAKLLQFSERMMDTKYVSIIPLLPMMYRIEGEPLTMKDHYPLEILYRTRIPEIVTAKTCRQIGKSANASFSNITRCSLINHYSILFLTPLFEQIRRFSTNYVQKHINESPISNFLMGKGSIASVQQKTLRNTKSTMLFSFAFNDANRVRGASVKQVSFDEYDDFDPSILGIVLEVMSHAQYPTQQRFGTPKTMGGPLQKSWENSSQAEWVIRCHNGLCNKWNVPSLDEDFDEMIGDVRDDICEERPGVVCAKCKRPLNPRHNGRWVHRFKKLKMKHQGVHVSQLIIPIHYASPTKWAQLVAKRNGAFNMTAAMFYNEVGGEAKDEGATLVGKLDLIKAGRLPPNKIENAMRLLGNYRLRILGVDWGGGGKQGISWTTYSIVGLRQDGGHDLIYGYRSNTPHDHEREAALAVRMMIDFQCVGIAHDFTAAGELRATLMKNLGVPEESLFGFEYHRITSKPMITFSEPTEANPTPHYVLDKTRSLAMVCFALKSGYLRTFEYDYLSSEEPGLLEDFLGLMEDRVESRYGSAATAIINKAGMTTDFAHSTNYACCGLWQITGDLPDFMEMIAHKYRLEEGLEAMLAGRSPRDYDVSNIILP